MILSECFAKLYHILPATSNPLQQPPPESQSPCLSTGDVGQPYFLLSGQLDAVLSGPQNSVDHPFPQDAGCVCPSEQRGLWHLHLQVRAACQQEGWHFKVDISLSFYVLCKYSLSYGQGEGLKGRLVSQLSGHGKHSRSTCGQRDF